MAVILITRELKPNDWLSTQFENSTHKLIGISFVEIFSASFNEFPQTEWIFFYSRNGVKHFIDQLPDPKELNNSKIAAIGQGTSEELRKRGLNADYIGAAQPREVAFDFLNQHKPKSVLFPRALHSRNSIRELIEKECDCYDIVVYSNTSRPKKIEFQPEILVFTSPMNVEAYMKDNRISGLQHVISIGPSTSEKLKELGIEKIEELKTPDEEAIYTTIMKNL